MIFAYDECDNQVKVSDFGLHDEPALNQFIGFQTVKMSYDQRGNCVAWEDYGADGNRCLVKDGYAKVTASYDARGNQIAWACFGLHDEPVTAQSHGAHAIKMSYDEHRYCTAREYYGVDGKRCAPKGGYAKSTTNYDDSGRQLEQKEFDLGGNATVKKYDKRGRQIEEAYFDDAGKPTTNKNGIARWIAKGPEGTNQADITYFDRDGTPIAVQIYVSEVLPDGQAKELGLAEGDVLVSYDGKPVTKVADIQTWTDTPGDALRELIVSRSGERVSFKLKPGKIGILMDVRPAPVAEKIPEIVK